MAEGVASPSLCEKNQRAMCHRFGLGDIPMHGLWLGCKLGHWRLGGQRRICFLSGGRLLLVVAKETFQVLEPIIGIIGLSARF